MLQAFQSQDAHNSGPGAQGVSASEVPPANSRSNEGGPRKEPDYAISPLAEPQSNLPLWRRVDRKFWWNEVMAKPFTEAGVGFTFSISPLDILTWYILR